MRKKKIEKPAQAPEDLTGRIVRLGDVELRTHVTILYGWRSERLTGKIKGLVTHNDPSKWSLDKIEKTSSGEDNRYSLASIEFKDDLQEEYELRSVGTRLIEDIDAEDLKNLKELLKLVDKHCSWKHEQRCYQ